MKVYDPSRPVARRVRQLLAEREAFASNAHPTYRFFTTGDTNLFSHVATGLLRFPVTEVGFAEI